jgi:hypothetical protein
MPDTNVPSVAWQEEYLIPNGAVNYGFSTEGAGREKEVTERQERRRGKAPLLAIPSRRTLARLS